MHWKKYVAEFIGTFMLAAAVGVSVAAGGLVITPVVAGLTLGLFVYTIGGISGAHVNPAVTVGMWVVKKINFVDAVSYIVAQLLGGVAAFLSVEYLAAGDTLPNFVIEDSLRLGVLEAVGAAILVFGVSSVVHGKVKEEASGLVIGGSLLLGVLMAGMGGTNGVLNPAVAIGIGSVSVMYLVAPVVGAIVSVLIYDWVSKK